ncbi:MAG: 2-oxoglutarate dehydrogenase complex dihydrolipoyllysine-residue succinyltransferase [Aggregatilineales bacterium]
MTTEIKVPEMGESVNEATVGQWRKQPGERVSVGEVLVELETDKVNMEIGAERDGVLARIERPTGQDVHVGDVLGVIDEAAQATLPAQPVKASEPPPPASSTPPVVAPVKRPAEPVKDAKAVPAATPVARRIAEERAVNLGQVSASGTGGKVTKGDVERFLSVPPTPVPTAEKREPRAERVDQPAREERVPLSRRRRTIARRLVEAQHNAAMLTTFNEVDMSAVMEVREKHKEAFKTKYGVSLGINSFFVKAAIGALKAFPRLNAEIDGDDMILKHYYDIGVAIGAEEGLVVPVLRDADRLSFAEIERSIKQYAQQASDGTLTLESLRGGTFTLTNGGVFGSMLSTPILNAPQVGILGLHKIEQRPVALNGQVVIRPMMYTALSYDHRIVDGREAVQFLVRVKALIEDPTIMLLEG